MNSAKFLQYLEEQVEHGRKKPAGQTIIRFKCPIEYAECIKHWKLLKTSRTTLPSIRQIGLIRALSCSFVPSERLLSFPFIESAEEDSKIQLHGVQFSLPDQQGGKVTPERTQLVPWGVRHIKAPQAWKTTMGGRIKVGVVDTGIDYSHPDLRGVIGKGVNLINRSLLPYDDNGHGTHIAGTIAAYSSAHGIIGVAPGAVIHPVKAFDADGSAFVSNIIEGIDWCVQNGLDIINMSFGMKTYSNLLDIAVTNAYQSGTVIIASSGNDSMKGSIDYPARLPQVISVGATTKYNKIAPFSNRGRRIDIYAPGEKILSTWLNGKYNELSGTSMATSHVSGVVALMLAVKPGLKPLKIRQILKKAAIPLIKGRVKAPGGIHAKRAVNAVSGPGGKSIK